MRGLPNALSALRLALAPVLLALAWSGAPRAFVCCLGLSLMTDIADGRIARRTGQASERGAVLDSWADLATYASLPPAAWWLRPGFVRAEALFLLVAVASYVAPVAIGFLKYGRLTSYHTRGAKLAAYLGGASALVVFAGAPRCRSASRPRCSCWPRWRRSPSLRSSPSGTPTCRRSRMRWRCVDVVN